MAITIIKHGTKPRARTKCSDCGCEFLFEREDMFTRKEECGYYFTYVKCPDCGYDICIPRNKLHLK